MKNRLTLIPAAVLLALSQAPSVAVAQAFQAPIAATASASAAAPKAALVAKTPSDWIRFDDASYTPVIDDVSRHLADARLALSKKEDVKAAEAIRASARALSAQADRAAAADQHRAAADVKLARDTHTRMAALVEKLDATAAQVEAGKLTTTAQLDKTLDKAARADLERRWLVTDTTIWYPVAGEPQRHFGAAAEAAARKDYRAAATEVRQGESYLRLESARAVGDVKQALNDADAGLDRMARGLDKGVAETQAQMHKTFAAAEHALALADRARAAQSWAGKAYDQAGYELKAAANELEGAAVWTGTEAKTAAAGASADARALGDKLTRGGVWAKDEVAKSFESLGTALNQLGASIGAKFKAAPLPAAG